MSKSIEIQFSDANLLEVNRTFVSPPDDHVFFFVRPILFIYGQYLLHMKNLLLNNTYTVHNGKNGTWDN